MPKFRCDDVVHKQIDGQSSQQILREVLIRRTVVECAPYYAIITRENGGIIHHGNY